MPYIEQSQRTKYQEILQELCKTIPNNDAKCLEGDVNYIISYIFNDLASKQLNYASINRIIGCIECAKIEFYRRIAAKYEDEKLIQNGDVYQF